MNSIQANPVVQQASAGAGGGKVSGEAGEGAMASPGAVAAGPGAAVGGSYPTSVPQGSGQRKSPVPEPAVRAIQELPAAEGSESAQTPDRSEAAVAEVTGQGDGQAATGAVEGPPAAGDAQQSPVPSSEKRVRDLQGAADRLRHQVKNQESQIGELQGQLAEAVARYRDQVLRQHPERLRWRRPRTWWTTSDFIWKAECPRAHRPGRERTRVP
ncbi:MAG: hypothetical protein NTU41_07310 [Chloroflexi bacterium]|nr:hypothetical protein [Chloroflexota bacterium]